MRNLITEENKWSLHNYQQASEVQIALSQASIKPDLQGLKKI